MEDRRVKGEVPLNRTFGITRKISQHCGVQENVKTQSYILCIWYSSDIARVTLLRMSGDMVWSWGIPPICGGRKCIGEPPA